MTRERSFSGVQLRIARTFNGLTQVDLAKKLTCNQSWIGHAEAGHKQPSSTLLGAICEVLGFEARFFEEPLIDEFRDEECNFRRRKATTVSTRARVLSHGTLFAQLARYLDACLSLPEDNIPETRVNSVDPVEAAERAADMCRMHWGLGLDRPVDNMCRVLEVNGAIVTRIDAGDAKVDAFSRPGRRHVVVLTSDKGRASRSRFDAAHELGHLVMHRGMPTGIDESEAQADRFASAFLLPRAGFAREFPRSRRIDWDRVLDIKQHWGASAAAIVRRAHDLQIIDSAQYQQAYKYMAWKRWSKLGEPNEPTMEHPETIRFACDTMRTTFGETAADLSRKLGWRKSIMQKVVCFQLPEEETPEAKGTLVFLDAIRAPSKSAGLGGEHDAEGADRCVALAPPTTITTDPTERGLSRE